MTTLQEIRAALSSLTIGGCAMAHHHVWKHGLELPPCAAALQHLRLDCAHSRTPIFYDAIESLSSEPLIPETFIACARKAVGLANEALWIADLLAIEIADVSQEPNINAAIPESLKIELREALALKNDGTLDYKKCEQLIAEQQKIGTALKLRTRSAILSVIDAIEEERGPDNIARIIALGSEALGREIIRTETRVYKSPSFHSAV